MMSLYTCTVCINPLHAAHDAFAETPCTLHMVRLQKPLVSWLAVPHANRDSEPSQQMLHKLDGFCLHRAARRCSKELGRARVCHSHVPNTVVFLTLCRNCREVKGWVSGLYQRTCCSGSSLQKAQCSCETGPEPCTKGFAVVIHDIFAENAVQLWDRAR